jgi:hypothetical protein
MANQVAIWRVIVANTINLAISEIYRQLICLARSAKQHLKIFSGSMTRNNGFPVVHLVRVISADPDDSSLKSLIQTQKLSTNYSTFTVAGVGGITEMTDSWLGAFFMRN